MLQVTLDQAALHFRGLLEKAKGGEEILVMQDDAPVAKVISLKKEVAKSFVFGSMRGKLIIADDFDEPLSDLFNEYMG